MKSLSIILLFLAAGFVTLTAQTKKPLSPPMTLEESINGVDIKVEYFAPSMRGRTIYGDLVPYDKVWRTGANDATKITFGTATTIEGQAIAAGTYSFFTIPGEDAWTVIFNKKANQWGHYSYSQAEDALRVEVTPMAVDESVEVMTIDNTEDGIVLKWDKVSVPVKIGK